MPFSKNQVTDQSSDLSDTADHSLNCTECSLFGMSELYHLTDHIQNFVYISFTFALAMKNG